MDMTRRRFIKNAGFMALGAVSTGLFSNLAFADKNESHKEEEEVSPSEDLMREHGILDRILLIYETSIQRLVGDGDFSLEVIRKTAQLKRSFIENYHEKLEEDYLFPRLLKAGQQVELVNTLLVQHQAGRRLTDTILHFTTPHSFQDRRTRNSLNKAMSQYIQMYRPHASREDTVLFPAFKKIVPENEYKELGEQFEEKEHALFGEGGFQTILGQVIELEKELGIYELSQFTPEV
jgi:hemerythrin-like domain-containing protein